MWLKRWHRFEHKQDQWDFLFLKYKMNVIGDSFQRKEEEGATDAGTLYLESCFSGQTIGSLLQTGYEVAGGTPGNFKVYTNAINSVRNNAPILVLLIQGWMEWPRVNGMTVILTR